MKFIETRFKNVLSFGFDEEYVIPYGESTFNMVFGDNGVGKTNFTKLIEIGLYFEYPEGVADIKNWYAKDEAFIEHTIESNGHIWKIKSVFTKKLKSVTVHKDGMLEDWGNPSSVQKKISEHIIDIPLSIFKNILCSSMDNVTSILKMNAKDSKEIVNQIFDIADIGLVGEYTSKYHFSKNKALSDKTVEKETLETNLKSQETLFEEFKENDTKEGKEKLANLELDLENAEKKHSDVSALSKDFEDKILYVNKLIIEKSIKNYNDSLQEIGKKIIEIDDDIKMSESMARFFKKTLYQKSLDKCLLDKSDENKEFSKLSDEKELQEKELQELSKIKDRKAIFSLVSTIKNETNSLEEFNKKLSLNKTVLDSYQEEYDNLLIKKDNFDKFSKYFKSLSETNAVAEKIKNDIKPNIDSLKNSKESKESEKEKEETLLNTTKSELIEIEKYLLFMENPVCSVKGCNMDFSSDKNLELLEKAKQDKIVIDNKIYSITKSIAKLKSDIGNIEIEQNKLKDDLITNVNIVKSFVKDDSYQDFTISFNDGVDLDGFKSKFEVIFTDEDNDRLNFLSKTIVDAKPIIEELEKSVEKSNTSIDFSKKTLFSSYEIENYSDLYFTDDEIKSMEEFTDSHREAKIDEFNKLSKKYSESMSKIAVYDEREKELRKLIELIVEEKSYEFDENIELQSYIDNEAKKIAKLGDDLLENSKLETEIITKLNIAKDELEKFENCTIFDITNEIPLEDVVKSLSSEKSKNDESLKLIEEEKTTIIANIKSLKESNNEEKYGVFDKAISEAKSKIEGVDSEVKELFEDFKSAELLKELYNNGWLKNELIGQVVGGINNIISEITEKYNISVSCEFDSGFNSKLFKYGVETKYGMCSLGQRKMLSLISIIAISSYYKQVYPKVNFIFLDEALSSLTEVNTNKMIGVINEYLVGKLNMTVFISHHSFLRTSYFDSMYKLEEINLMTKVSCISDGN